MVSMTRRAVLPTVASATVAAMAGCGSRDPREGGVTLTYASFVPEDHSDAIWYKQWAAEVTEATRGRVTFENYFSESLLAGPELGPGVSDGRVDLVTTNTNYTPHLFPLCEISAVPYEIPNPGAGVKAFVDLYRDFQPFRDEFEKCNVVPLHFRLNGSSLIGGAKSASNSDEINGMRIRANSMLADFVDRQGGDALNMPLSDVFQSMETGLLDGFMTVLENFDQYSFDEVVSHVVDSQTGPFGLSAMLINRDAYLSISQEDRAAMEELNYKYNKSYIEEYLNKVDAESCELLANAGIDYEIWDDDAVQEAKEAAGSAYTDEFVRFAVNRGADGEGFLAAWREAQETYDGSYGTYRGSVATCLDL